MTERDIETVLWFRDDISPFLVHLTRRTDKSAQENLVNILETKKLRYGDNDFSDAKFGYERDKTTNEIKTNYFSAASFTETPLNEIHNLFDISGRNIDLEPYGLVFLKDNLKKKGVSPVIYLNNFSEDKINLVNALCSFIETNPSVAKQILPYIAVFGKKLLPIKDSGGVYENIDFTWEREWRFSSPDHFFKFEIEDVFIGLCSHDEIKVYEESFPPLLFIDPIINRKMYAEKLVEARHRAKLKNSVV